MKICHACGKEVVLPHRAGRKDACPFCRADLRCCLNCTFYEPAAYNQCREGQAERVLEKDRANFCDFFRFREGGTGTAARVALPTRDKLDALFKKQ